ncbi:hypothetical protein EVV80_28755, partial [Klebsiella pneumoniae]
VLAETVSAGAAGAARYLFFAKDWIRFRLTGVAALELTVYWLKQYQPARLAPRAICFSPRTGSAFA